MESSEARMALPEMSQIEVRGLGHCSSASIRNWFLRREPWAQQLPSAKSTSNSTLNSQCMECLSLTGEIWAANYTTPQAVLKPAVLAAAAVQSLSRVQLFATSELYVAHQSLSMGFSRQEYWSGLPFLCSGDLADPGTEPTSSALAGRFFTTEPPGKPMYYLACFTTFTPPISNYFDPCAYNPEEVSCFVQHCVLEKGQRPVPSLCQFQ